ncbi:amidohydrolase family protein [Synoicihabitans lomoniglobus]|uniref:Amidohydrolase family protein n=1 Tax=Synoicihabitans lomoniglobus TaxID=2909285 RepID=A0AAE9ZRV1_9BACT|nr:amidohydrolase family protein [Opitutaceae bacterium LMO-M01]WED64095.1 amidohydrolase family protein [Opitutaceae bacterium LMO-M01]
MSDSPGFSRRNFMKRLGTGSLALTLAPVMGRSAAAAGPHGGGVSSSGAGGTPFELPRFFDCNRYLGPGFSTVPDFPTPASLVEEMDRLHIDRSLVWHTDARTAHPLNGNERLIKALADAEGGDRLVPAFVVAPSVSVAGPEHDAFVELVHRHDVRAFRYFPRSGEGGLEDLNPLIERLASRRPVLLLDCFESMGRGANLGRIIGFAERHPNLTLIFTNAMWVHHDRLYELMAARPNIRMETSLVHTYRTVEHVVEKFGAERMLFGTGYRSNYGAAIANLVHSPMTAAQREQVAHGNVEQLLQVRRPLRGGQTLQGDTLWHRLLRREVLGPLIIDAHAHMGYGGEWEDHHRPEFADHMSSALRYLDEMGVQRMIIAEHQTYRDGELGGLTRLEAGLADHRDRFNAYLSAQVFLQWDQPPTTAQLDEIFRRGFYVGFKTHTDHWQVPLTDERFIPMWEYANRHRLPILSHTWTTPNASPKLLREIAPRYPDAFFLLAHSGNRDRDVVEELMQDNLNVYLEWAGSFVNPDDWRPVMDRQGNQRILWGADGVGWEHRWGHSPAWEMGRFLSIGLSDERLIPMLGANMQRILAKNRFIDKS